MRLQVSAPGKVNLCLFLGETVEHGRHQLLTLFQSLSLADTLTLDTGGLDDTVICAGVAGDNLVSTAIAMLRDHGWSGPRLAIHIDKRIPVAAGMAGGSADAAAALRLAAAVSPVEPQVLELVASELGSDVPSQLVAGVSLGTGAGDVVERLAALPECAYVVIPSDEALSTADVYREADRLGLGRSEGELETLGEQLRTALASGQGPAPIPRELMINDLQSAAISLCSSITVAIDAALAAGADHAMVSGSGPTVVGIWWGSDAAAEAESAQMALAESHPLAVVSVPVGPESAAVEAQI